MDETKSPPTETPSISTRTLGLHFLGKGLARSSPILCFALVVPDLVVVLIETGLKNMGIVVAGVFVLVLLTMAMVIGRLPARSKAILGIVSMYLTGGFSLLAGLQLQFGVNRESALNITVICSVMVASSLAAFADLSLVREKLTSLVGTEDFQRARGKKYAILWEAVGLIAPLVGLGFLFLLTSSITYVFFCIGGLYLLLPSVWITPNPHELEAVPDAPRGVRRMLNGQIFTRLFAWAIVLAVFTAGAFTEQPSSSLGWGILGVACGMFLYQVFPRNKYVPVSLVGMLGLIACYMIIYLELLAIASWGVMVLLGLLAGYVFGSVETDLRTFPKQRRKNVGLWSILWVLLVFGGIYLGREIQDEIAQSNDILWSGFLIFGGVGVVALFIEVFARKRVLSISPPTSQKPLEGGRGVVMPFAGRKRPILALSLCLLVAMPSLTSILYLNSHAVVWIDLPTTMYTVDGTAVTRVELRAKTAKILLYSPNPTGTAHDETIRARKSIRLGAYFYGMGGTSIADAIQWIGTNLDVYSLGMCGHVFSPENISAMRALNPQAKFYYMTYATTLFENASSTYLDGTFGATQLAYMKFNDTMAGWTLKLKDGTEALGVRRDSPTSDAHLMDLGKLEWADYFAWIYTRRANDYHADGVAIDEVMWNGYWGTKVSELRDYTSIDQIKATCYAWLARLDAQTNLEVITQAFWPAAQVYQNGTWGESSFRSGEQYGDRIDDRSSTIWYESMTWKQVIEDIGAHAAQNKSYIWAAWYEQNSTEAIEYAVASYLMGKPNNYTKIAFHPQAIYNGGYPANLAGYSVQTVQEEVAAHPEYYNLEMGDATGPMFEVQGIGGTAWQRNFTNGIVLVNPNHAFLPGFE